MPARSSVIVANLDRLIDLGVSKRFVLALVPSEAAEDAQILCQLLLGVIAKAVFQRAEMLVPGNRWRLVDAGEIRLDRLAINAHVRAIGIEQQACCALALSNKAVPP